MPPASDKLFAMVAVDQPVDAAYSYEVPAILRRGVTPGSRVLVPLGRGNRLVEGTVLSLSDRPPDMEKPPLANKTPTAEAADVANLFADAGLPELPGAEGARKGSIKAIADVMHDVTPVPADLLDLAKWISTYYCAPIGMTLASMVPAAVKRGTRLPANVRVSLTDTGRNAGGADPRQDGGQEANHPPIKMSPQARKGFQALREFLAAGPKLEHEVLAAAQMSRPMLKRLVSLGFVAMEREIKVPEHAPVGASLAEHQSSAAGQRAALNLTPDQQAAMAQIEPLVDGSRGAVAGGVAEAGGDGDGHEALRGVADSGFAVRLIHGVTGSGKTELYIRAIERVVARGKRAIVLVPEISLTPQAVKRFTARFPRVAVLHSGLKNSERAQHWHAIATGWAQVIVGARSAIFAPAADLGLIVVDEEHDSSYKQDSLPKYHGRDVAIRRAQMLGIPILLGSATPALESWHNAHHHANWGLVSLRSRPLGAEMPRVVTVDMKGEAKLRRGLHILSTVLEHHLKQTLAAKKQAIFLLNRRGYAHYLLCPRCDWVLMCDNCDATMVVHRTHSTEFNPARAPGAGGGTAGGGGGSAMSSAARQQSARVAARDSVGRKDSRQSPPAAPRHHIEGTVQCHYCLTSMLLPEHCPLCKARLTHLGQGTQRAEDEILRKFPELRNGRLKRMDSDSMSNLGEYQKTLDAFGRGDIDLLIGTQMISKGLDFPNVALVGVLNSDLAMTIPDFRASERTFQLICQVAGRAGRAMAAGGAKAAQGSVVVQTFQPGEPAIAHACRHDYLGFVRTELPHRKEFGYPPYGRLVRIVLAHKGYSEVKAFADSLVRLIYALTTKLSLPVRVHGPIPPPMERIMNEYRMEIVLFSDSALPLQRFLTSLRARGVLASAKVTVSVDVDPVHML